MIFIYNLLIMMMLPLLAPYLWWRKRTGKETANSLEQKMGLYRTGRPKSGAILLHAVSVGEAISATPLIERLMADHPTRPIIFTLSTGRGMEVAKAKFGGNSQVSLLFFPFDFPFSARSFVTFLRPALIIFMEAELWPNVLFHCKREGIPTMLVNGRVSDKSFGKYMKLRWLFAKYLQEFKLLLMQSETDRSRIVQMGGRQEVAKNCGNLKFDKPAPAVTESKEQLKQSFGLPADKPVMIIASTHSGEDAPLLKAFIETRKKLPELMCVIAPRHPERGKEVAAEADKLSLSYGIRSNKEAAKELLILDTIGELGKLYAVAELAIMGGSFIPHGGQNPLEPASVALPVIFGKHMANFKQISELMIKSGGGVEVASAEAVVDVAIDILTNKKKAMAMGKAGQEMIEQNRGTLERVATCVKELLEKNEQA